MLKEVITATLSVLFAAVLCSAQATVDRKCSGRVFKSSEVTKRAKILERPDFRVLQDALGPGTRARFVVDAVLCRSGQVTDIRVLEGVSPEIDQFAIGAVSMVKFEPAEDRWHSVSQSMRFEANFGSNEPGVKGATSGDSNGRLVERVNVIGNRRLTAGQVFFWIQTRPGDSYREDQLKRDLEAVLASGYFDKTQTRVMIEDGVRGGVAVIFEVVELPLISEINFEGVKIDRTAISETLRKENIVLQPGSPYDGAAVKKAAHIITIFLAANGHGDFNVASRTEYLTAQKVNLTFVITPNK